MHANPKDYRETQKQFTNRKEKKAYEICDYENLKRSPQSNLKILKQFTKGVGEPYTSEKENTNMTNEQIIFNNSIELMDAGIIRSTGRTIIVEDENGQKTEMQEPEPIHTYQAWKQLGYQVQRGQKAKASFLIWKHTVKKAKQEQDEDEEKMFMTKAFFFTFDQVEPIEEKTADI